MIKKITALLLSLTLAAAAFTSCGSSDSSAAESSASSGDSASQSESTADSSEAEAADVPEASLTIDGEKIDTSDIVMLTVDGVDIDFDLFRYYYFSVQNTLCNYYGVTPEQIAADEELFATFKSALLEQFKNDFVSHNLAAQYGIELTEDEEKELSDGMETIIAEYDSEEEFNTAIAQNHLTREVYMTMLKLAKLYDKVENQLFAEGGELATSEEDFRAVLADKDEYSRVRHILIPYYCQAEITDEDDKSNYESMSLYEKGNAKQKAYNALTEEEQEKLKTEAKKLADDVLKKAQDGEDFDALIKEYGWDPGMESNPNGYYVNKNTSFVEEFKTKCFELKENEISDLITSDSFGWFIIKRLPIDEEYVNENIASLISEYDQPRFETLKSDTAQNIEIVESDYFKNMSFDSIT